MSRLRPCGDGALWEIWVAGAPTREAVIPRDIQLRLSQSPVGSLQQDPILWKGDLQKIRDSCLILNKKRVVCVGCLIFKDTEPSPLQDSFNVRQQGGLPGPPPQCVC